MTVGAIGFIGLGNMGGPMAANLVRAGYKVMGFDVAADASLAAAGAGVTIVSSPEELAGGVSALVTMLPSGKHVVSVWSALVPLLSPGTLIIDSSTIDVDSARAAHAIAATHSCPSLDAPVSGGAGGAKASTLTFIVGGSREAFEHGRPILSRMGKNIFHCGDAGTGQAAKICNNMILGISMIGVCEAFALGEKLGLSQQALYDVAAVSSGQCWSLTSYCPVPGPVPTSPANADYKPGFATALMLKDLKLAQKAAETVSVSTPMGALASQLYALFDRQGHGNEDFSAIIRFLRQRGAE
jgi:3-hydroxyisobutyrate dehydrogenase